MTKSKRPLADRIRHAEERSAHWLMIYNEMFEKGRGHTPRAVAAYEKSARWLITANELARN